MADAQMGDEAEDLLETGGIAEISAALAVGRTRSVALAEAALRRIEDAQPRINAFIAWRADEALEAAEASDRRRAGGAPLGPLDGVPYALKDLIDATGWPTTAGARILDPTPKRRDAAVTERLRQAGAVLLGKTGLHELAYGVTTVNPHFGPVANPWDPQRSPGGSSGGSGAAIAARLVPLALGTDTGCSIRHPAHCCGVVGFKPSHGRVSAAGVTPLVRQLDHVGPLTADVRSAALAMDALSAFDPDDPFARDFCGPLRAAEAVEAALSGAPRPEPTLARLRGDGFEDGDPETLKLVQAAIDAIAEVLGARLLDLEPSGLFGVRRAAGTLFAGDPSAEHGLALRRTPKLIGEDVRRKLDYGMRVSAGALAAAQQEVRLFRRRIAAAQADSGAAALLAPTCGAPAPPLNEPDHFWADLATVACTPFNASGQPAISIPCGLTQAGLPVGLMLIGADGRDASLIALAALAERALASAGVWPNSARPRAAGGGSPL